MIYYRLVSVLLLLSSAFSIQAQDREDQIKVKRIKMEIGSNKYVWDEDQYPQPASEEEISPEAVLSFTILRPGLRISLSELEREAALLEARLKQLWNQSNW